MSGLSPGTELVSNAAFNLSVLSVKSAKTVAGSFFWLSAGLLVISRIRVKPGEREEEIVEEL